MTDRGVALLNREFRKASDEGHYVLMHPRATISCRLGSDEVELGAEFTRPFDFELSVRILQESDYLEFFSKPELTFDDPGFDEALLVRGFAYRVRSLLTPHVRQALMDLRGCATALALTQERLVATCGAANYDVTAEAVDAFLAALDALTGRSEAGPAYR
ncbi:MAG: hypothetical protein R3B13_35395 [Polyangiaceae bacterium]